MKKLISILMTVVLLASVLVTSTLPTSAATKKSQADAASSFTFSNGKMSKEVLRSYLSRAVTHQSLGTYEINEELRMLTNIGAKFIGRAHHFSWAGNLSAAQIEDQYKFAKEMADKAHAADPEMILQAGIFEIAYKGTVENTKVPTHVLEAFGQKVEDRNFDWDKIVFPKGTKTVDGFDVGIGCWGTGDEAGVPDITKTETKMYFYNQICRYIDAGYEAFHMGQAERMMLYMTDKRSKHYDELLTKARDYAKTHARRGLALFDCHTQCGSGGPKVGNRLIFDAIAAGLCPNETVKEDGAMKCEIKAQDSKYWLSWIGTSAGGEHPLGFTIEENFTILEFDNYGIGTPGVATPIAFMNWGFDDISWYAIQPEWYRNEFLLYCDNYLSNTKSILDSAGKQQYFIQPQTIRNVTWSKDYFHTFTYTPGKAFNQGRFDQIIKRVGASAEKQSDGSYTITVKGWNYLANNRSDACPIGYNQEDTIKQIFLGVQKTEPSTSSQSGTTNQKPTASQGNSKPSGNTASSTDTTVSVDDTQSGEATHPTESDDTMLPNDTDNSFPLASDDNATEDTNKTDSDTEGVSSEISTDGNQPNNSWVIWLVIGVIAVVLIGGGAVAFILIKNKKK